jgi:hypothetical protein
MHKRNATPLAARRALLRGLGYLAGLGAFPRRGFAGTPRTGNRPLVGAIRWDAWYAPESPVGRAVEKSLAPERYHWRLPFFSKVVDQNRIVIDGAHQAIMDEEIHLAAQGGLDYWAFDAYLSGSEMSVALRLYLASAARSRIRFCLLSGLDLWQYPETADRHLSLMCQPGYQRLLNGRPLYYLAFITEELLEARMGGAEHCKTLLDRLRAGARRCGAGDPYIVIIDSSPLNAAKYARLLAADAIGSYGTNQNRHRATFAQSATDDRAQWDAERATGFAVVPTITTGNDRRPRYDTPVFWENEGRPWPAYFEDIYVQTAKPAELADLVRHCVEWLRLNAAAAPAQTILVYAWNENDEGGWLIPTLPFDKSRLDALRSVLRP